MKFVLLIAVLFTLATAGSVSAARDPGVPYVMGGGGAYPCCLAPNHFGIACSPANWLQRITIQYNNGQVVHWICWNPPGPWTVYFP